jgi:hypothetical protein
LVAAEQVERAGDLRVGREARRVRLRVVTTTGPEAGAGWAARRRAKPNIYVLQRKEGHELLLLRYQPNGCENVWN